MLGAAVWLLTGCTTLPMNPDYAGPKAMPQELADQFAYTLPKVWTTGNETVERGWGYRVERVRFRSAVTLIKDDGADGHDVVLDYYEPTGWWRGDAPRPAIMVLPILGGAYEAAKYFGGHFARAGFAAVVVHKNDRNKDPDSIADLNATFRQMVLDHRQALDWMATEPGIDIDRVGVFGISAGAIKGSLVYAVDPRLRAALLALPGGDIPYILAYSNDPGVRRRRVSTLSREDITAEQLYAELKAGFRYDPLDLAPYADARHVLMILGERDRVVFYKKGLELREAMGGPKTEVLPTGHYDSIVFTPFIQDQAVDFFRAELAAREP